MATFPIMLKLEGRPVVVIGGGPVGVRKVQTLLAAGASVTLVAPNAAASPETAGAKLLAAEYRTEHIAGAALIFACTDDRKLNSRIAREARAAGVLINVADEPDECDFIMPSVSIDGPVVLAVGTSGAAPNLAARLRQELAAAMPKRIGEFAAAIGELRVPLKKAVPDRSAREQIARRLCSEEAYRAFLAGGVEALKQMLREAIEE